MNRKAFLIFFLVTSLVLPLFMSSPVQSAYLSFSFTAVETDKTVEIRTKTFPANVDFVAMMGEMGTKGVKGIEVAKFNSEKGGTFALKLDIPEALYGRKEIVVRFEGVGGWWTFNTFINDPAGTAPDGKKVPAGSTTSTTVKPGKVVPLFTIKNVDPGKTVTISTSNFPKNIDFTAMIGKADTKGIKGIEVGKFNSADGGAFEATFNVPEKLQDEGALSIRVEGTYGWFAYNWFPNKAGTAAASTPAATSPAATPAKPAVVKIPVIMITAVDAGKTVTLTGNDFPADKEFVVRMGQMWTRAINGIQTAKFTSDSSGAFEASFEIPEELAKNLMISIRMDSTDGYYSYNWFWNNSTTK